ncbi:hypothetical protein ABPG72_018430 [Tetrahymena utriculariae]
MKAQTLIFCLIIQNFIKGQNILYQSCVCTQGGANENDPCAWITPTCPKFDSSKQSFCCSDFNQCFDVTDELNVQIGGFKKGRCLTPQDSTFYCKDFTQLQINQKEWKIIVQSGDISNISNTNPVCLIQDITVPDNCIGYTSLNLVSLNNQSGNSKVCIQNQSSSQNKNADYCLGTYCKTYSNQACIDTSQEASIYSQYGIIGFDGGKCLDKVNTQGQVVSQLINCFQASVSQVCFNQIDNTCWDLSVINELDSSKPIGRFQDGTCVSYQLLNQYSTNQIQFCAQNIKPICLDYSSQNQYRCAQWDSILAQPQTQPIGIFQDGSCAFLNVFQSQKILNCVINMDSQACIYNNSLRNNNQQGCIQWNQQDSTFNTIQPYGIYLDGSCAFLNDYNNKQIKQCNTKTNVCLATSSNNLKSCDIWDLPNNNLNTKQPIGIFIDGSCAYLDKYGNKNLNIQSCNTNITYICKYNSNQNNNQQGCINWNIYQSQYTYQPVGVFIDGTCAFYNNLSQNTIQNCYTQSNFICIYNSNANNNYQGCIQWNQSYNQNNITYKPIGVFTDGTCALYNNYQQKTIQQCNNNMNFICTANQSSKGQGQGCIDWKLNFLNQIDSIWPIGIFNDKTCAFPYIYQLQTVTCNTYYQEVCYNIQNFIYQACLLWNLPSLNPQLIQAFGRYNDGTCIFQNNYSQKQIFGCNYQSKLICQDTNIIQNNNQTIINTACMRIDLPQQNNKQIIGVYNDGTCAFVNQLQNKQIINCNTQEITINVCIYNNNNINNGQNGCIQWKNASSLINFQQTQPIGIYQDGSCAFLNTYYSSNIQNCNNQIQDICIDNTINNYQACILWNYSQQSAPFANNNAVGIFNDQTCVFLNQYENKQIQLCNKQINSICFDNTNTARQACLNWKLQQISAQTPKPTPIGLFTDFTCVFLGTYASKQIQQWNNLYNICKDVRNQNNQAYFQWDIDSTQYQQNKNSPIGIYSNGSCAYLNVYKNMPIQYCTNSINFICLDNTISNNQGCAQWDLIPSLQLNNNFSVIGIFNGRNCVMLNIYSNSEVQNCNFKIDFICQDIRSTTNQSCLNFSIAQNQIVGEDQNHICLIEGQASAVKCSKSYCIDQDQSCKRLDGIDRIITQKDTYKCLPYTSEQEISDAIWCAINYCRIQRQDGTYYCTQLGDYFSCKDDQTHICMTYKDTSSVQIVELTQNYCYLQINGNSYQCINTDQEEKYVIKDTQNQCQTFSSQEIAACYQDSSLCHSTSTTILDLQLLYQNVNSFIQILIKESFFQIHTVQAKYCGESTSCSQPKTECVVGPLCLNSSQNCVHLDYSQTFNFPGRQIQTSLCLPLFTFQNKACSKNYCVLDKQCFLMSQNLYVSQEIDTFRCLKAEETGNNGALFCIIGFCKQKSIAQLNFCIKMADSITNDIQGYIATDKNGQCISSENAKNNPNIYSCLINIFCLDNTNSCVLLDPTQTCIDSNYRCASIDSSSCSYCHLTQCLDNTNCILIPQKSCLGFNGKCTLAFQNGVNQICKTCAQKYCYNSLQSTCISFLDMNVDQKQCIIQSEGNSKCQIVSLDTFNYCADYYGQCQQLPQNDQINCLRCPKTYVWVGSLTCFSSQMIEQILQKNQTQDNSSFSLSLIYKQLDISQNNQLCGQGCQKCLNTTTCLQCSFEYYLYDDQILKQQYCNSLPDSVKLIQYPDSLFEDEDYLSKVNDLMFIQNYKLQDYYFDLTDSTYQKVQINGICINQWQSIKIGDVVKCDTFNIQYKYISQIIQNPQIGIRYIVSLDSNQQVVFKEANQSCIDSNCKVCQIMSNGKEQCFYCKDKFTLNYQKKCQPCPNNCNSCYYGGLYQQHSTNWSLLISQQIVGDFDFSQLSSTEYQLLCQQCESNYVVAKDYTGCEKCGDNCQKCYQGLSKSQSQSIVKRCLVCNTGFVVGPTMIDCIQKQQNCEVIYFGKQDGGSSSFTSQLWWDNSIQSYEPKCYTCSGLQSVNNGNQATCLQTQDSNIGQCQNLVKFQSQTYCISCMLQYPFDYNIRQGQCDVNSSCSDNIYQCIKCYSYKDSNQKQVYQCTKCQNKDLNVSFLPTYFGCTQCPKGCSSCYESQIYIENINQVDLKNRTHQIIYEQIKPSLQDKLNSLNKNDYEIVCSSCYDGYYLLNKLCVKNLCGVFCDLCYMKNYYPICISCSYDALKEQIKQISNYILTFYQYQNFNFRYMTHFTSDKQDCFLCPIGCASCEQNNIGINPYKLYDVKCYSCKKIVQLDIANVINPNITKNYEWRWNKETQSCSLCLKSQMSCVYRKETDIYVTCKNVTDSLGSGTQSDPLNLSRSIKAQWDSLIVNSIEFSKSLVYMNELGVREILANIYIKDKKCVLHEPISISTSLLQLIPKLEILQINIIGNQTLDVHNTFPATTINLFNSFSINGFLNVEFQNLDFQQPNNTDKSQVIYINNTDTNSVLFNNCSINGTLNTYFDISSPQKNNSKLSFFSFLSSQNGMQLQEFNLTINNFTASNVYFQQSQIISLQYSNITMQINDTNIIDSLIIQNSLLFMINQTNSTSQCSNQVSFLKIIRNQIYSNSQIFFLQNLVYNFFQSIFFDGNIIQNQNKYSGLIEINQLICTHLTVNNNILSQASVFKNIIGERKVQKSNSSYLFFFDHSTINNNTISQYESSVFFYTGSSKEYNTIKLSNIQISEQNQQDERLKSSLFVIQTCHKTVALNFNITNINQVTVILAQNLNYYLARNINIVNNNLSQQKLTNTLFSIQQIFYSIDLILFNSQNIVSNSPIIDINNGINMSQGQNSVINLSQINFNNTNMFVQQQFIVTSIITIKTTLAHQINLRNLNFLNNQALLDSNLIVNSQLESCSCFCIDSEQSKILLEFSNFTNNYSNSTRNAVSVKSIQMIVNQCNFVNQMKNDINSSITKGGLLYSKAFILKLLFCYFFSGFAKQGGALYFKGYFDSQLYLTQTQIFQCRTALSDSSSQGGAIFIDTQYVKNLNIYIMNSQISNNLATISGGAFYIIPFEGNVFFFMTNSIMQNNFAQKGAILDFSFVGNGIGRVILTQSQIYNDPFRNLDSILKIIKQQDNKFSQQSYCSLFQFTTVTQIEIVSNTFESSNNYLNQFNITQQESLYLYPALFNIRFSKEYSEYNNTYLNFYLSNYFISVQANTIKIIQTLFQSIKLLSNSTNAANLIIYDSNFIQLQNSQFIDLQCSLCQISSLHFKTEQFQILGNLFQKNIGSQQGGQLLIKQQIQSDQSAGRFLQQSLTYFNTIRNCRFVQNSAYDGGALTIQFYDNFGINIQQSQFLQNQALNKGGAIHYQQLLNNKQMNLYLLNNLFNQNIASVGAVLYTNVKQYLKPIQNLNAAFSNIAKNFGSFQISSPNSMILYCKQIYYQNNSVITVQSSGKLQDDLIVLLLDEQGQQYKELEQGQQFLQAQQISSSDKTYMQNTKILFQNGIFNLTNYLNIFGNINQILSIQLTFDQIRNEIIQNYSLVINFMFDSTCQIGYLRTKTQNNFDQCTPCKNNSFSLIPNTTSCNQCPKVDGFICFSNVLLIPNGYWKINQASPIFLVCSNSIQNCVGDTESNKQIRNQLNALKRDKNSPQIYYCNEGYLGALCEDCDILGEYWNQKYYKISQYQCQSCKTASEYLAYQWIFLTLVIVLNVCLIYVSQQSFIDQLLYNISLKLKNRESKFLKVNFSESYVLIKLIINYFQILALLILINPNFLNIDFTFLKIITNPVYEIISQLDCVFSELYLRYFSKIIEYIFFRIVLAQILVALIYLAIVLSFILTFKKKISFSLSLRTCISVIVVLITLNVTGIASLILETISCLKVQEVYYVQIFTRIVCDDEYYSRAYVNSYPFLILWAAFLFLLISILKQNYFKLDQFQYKCCFGFLYNQYKKNFYYWEFINICQKIIIVLAIKLTGNQGIQFGLSLSTIISYKLLIQKCNPNQSYRFNNLEKKVSNSLIITSTAVFNSIGETNIYNRKIAIFIFIFINAKVLYDFLSDFLQSAWEKFIQKIEQKIQKYFQATNQSMQEKKVQQKTDQFIDEFQILRKDSDYQKFDKREKQLSTNY